MNSCEAESKSVLVELLRQGYLSLEDALTLANSLDCKAEKRVDDISFRNLSPKGMEYLYGMRPENVQN